MKITAKRKTLLRRKTSAQAVHLLITKLAEKPAETTHSSTEKTCIQPDKTSAAHQNHQSYLGFLQNYPNKQTRQNCREALQKYLRFTIAEEPEKTNTGKAFDDSYNTLGETYLKQLKTGRNYTEDLTQFTEHITKTRSPETARRIVSVVRRWLENNGYSLTGKTKTRLSKTVKQAVPLRNEIELTKPLFKTIYKSMTKEWAKTLLLIMLSTGMTISEALSLKETDIIKTETGTIIHIRKETTKTKTERIAYLTEEAAESLEKHLAEQKIQEQKRTEKEQRTALKNPEKPKTPKNLTTQQKIRQKKAGCIFPYSVAAAEGQMRRAVDKAGYGRVGVPRSIYWKITRKWFITQLSLCADRTAAEELAGYVRPYSMMYQKTPAEELFTAFKKAEKHLTLFPKKKQQKKNPEEK